MRRPPALPGYSDVVEIGRGGQARIYRAFNESLSRFEAVKIYAADGGDPAGLERARRRFQAEASITGQSKNPHVITVHRSELHDGVLCLFMEHIDGPSLRAVLDDPEAKLSLPQIVAIAADIGNALDHLASMPTPVIHRDVKPDNILLERDPAGGFRRAVLADFGVSTRLTGSNPDAESAGTPSYMSPEQLLRKPATPRSDQYGLACTVYELLAGQPPFPSPSAFDRVLAIADANGQEPYPPIQLAGRRMRRADQVLRTALSADPARRHPDSASFAAGLAAALGVSRLGPRRRMLAVARRHPGRTAAALVAALTVLAVGGLAAHRALSDLRTVVNPVLARPGLYSPCPDLLGQGFSPDPRFSLDNYLYATTEDTLLLAGEPGDYRAREFSVEGMLASPGFTFHLNPAGVLTPMDVGDRTPSVLLQSTCRYVADLGMPADGAVLNVYPRAFRTAGFDLRPDEDVAARLGLEDPRTVTVGLDADHKAEYTMWASPRPPYDLCVAELTGHDGADVDPVLVLHQDRNLGPSACAKLEDLLGSQLESAWRTMSPQEQRAGPRQPPPARPTDEEVWSSLIDGTRPCTDHSAVGLRRIGPATSPVFGEGCWHEDPQGRRALLFQARPGEAVRVLDDSSLNTGRSEPSPTFDGHLDVQPFEVDGEILHGTFGLLRFTTRSEIPGDGTVPYLWMETGEGPDEDLVMRQAAYTLNALIYRAVGHQDLFWG